LRGTAELMPWSAPRSFLAARVERVFNDCFADSCNTRLCGGAAEPLYQPAANPADFHALYYRGDYFASALHEVAHWCIAGAQRRQQPDFGYWYTPDDRSADQQRAFEAVECKPQALEWYFARACGYRFQVSADNLALASAGLLDTAAFKRAVLAQALVWQHEGLPIRAGVFYAALRREFGTAVPAAQLDFSLSELA
jgi:elongation factor P hydroxylase